MDERPRFALDVSAGVEIHLEAPGANISPQQLHELRHDWSRCVGSLAGAPVGSEIAIRVDSCETESWCVSEIYAAAVSRNLHLRLVGASGAVSAWVDALRALEPSGIGDLS